MVVKPVFVLQFGKNKHFELISTVTLFFIVQKLYGVKQFFFHYSETNIGEQ